MEDSFDISPSSGLAHTGFSLRVKKSGFFKMLDLTRWKEPISKMTSQIEAQEIRGDRYLGDQMDHLMRGRNMRDIPLSVCLDSCDTEIHDTLYLYSGAEGLTEFIKKWMEDNQGSLEDLWVQGRSEEEEDPEFPRIDYEECPNGGKVKNFEEASSCASSSGGKYRASSKREKEHGDRIRDRGGIIRCAHVEENSYTEDSLDRLSEKYAKNHPFTDVRKVVFAGEEPSPEEEGEEEIDMEDIAKVHNACYAVISEEGIEIPLETVIERRDVLSSTPLYNNYLFREEGGTIRGWKADQLQVGREEDKEISDRTEFPFGGQTLALFAKMWYEQSDDPRAYNQEPVSEYDSLNKQWDRGS